MAKGKYDDIIDLPHHTSKKHPRMSMHNRAAQFSPFAALNGHSSAINETARLTDRKIQLTEDEKSVISEKLSFLRENEIEKCTVTVKYFLHDAYKSGGEYIVKNCRITRIDEFLRTIKLDDGDTVEIDDIYDIDSVLFQKAD